MALCMVLAALAADVDVLALARLVREELFLLIAPFAPLLVVLQAFVATKLRLSVAPQVPRLERVARTIPAWLRIDYMLSPVPVLLEASATVLVQARKLLSHQDGEFENLPLFKQLSLFNLEMLVEKGVWS